MLFEEKRIINRSYCVRCFFLGFPVQKEKSCTPIPGRYRQQAKTRVHGNVHENVIVYDCL